MPAEIGQLTHLQELYLPFNQLTTLPSEKGIADEHQQEIDGVIVAKAGAGEPDVHLDRFEQPQMRQNLSECSHFSQFEPWYHELVKQFCAVADFRRYWERTPSLVDQQDVPSKLLLGRNATTEEWLPIELQNIRISVCSHMYPCIMALRPLDNAARDVFASLSSVEGSPFNAVRRR